jgi:hypothetical protein
MNKQVLQIKPDGTVTAFPCSYSGISAGVGAPFDFIGGNGIGMYVDDEGLLNGSRFNGAASMITGRAIYGNAVLCHDTPDSEGNTLPPSEHTRQFAELLAKLWRNVVLNAEQVGQDVMPKSNEATVPAQTITSFDNLDDFFKAIGIDGDD